MHVGERSREANCPENAAATTHGLASTTFGPRRYGEAFRRDDGRFRVGPWLRKTGAPPALTSQSGGVSYITPRPCEGPVRHCTNRSAHTSRNSKTGEPAAGARGKPVV